MRISFTQWCFVPSLVAISLVVLEKKSKMLNKFTNERTERETNIQTDRQTDAEQKVIGKAQLTFQSGELRKKVPDLYHLLKYMYYVSFLFWMVENNFTTRPCLCFDPRIVFSQWEKLSYMRRENPNFKTWRIRRRVVC